MVRTSLVLIRERATLPPKGLLNVAPLVGL